MPYIEDTNTETSQWLLLLEAMPEYVFVIENGEITFVNRSALAVTGLRWDKVVGKDVEEFIRHDNDHDWCDPRLQGRIDNFTLVVFGGVALAVEASVFAMRQGDRTLNIFLARPHIDQSIEVEALKHQADRLFRVKETLTVQVECDMLTGLLNRRGMERIIKRELGLARYSGTITCAALLDLDDFKAINERYGHGVGDDLLQAVSERLRSSVRETDYIARIGGDELLILMPDTDRDSAMLAAERCINALSASPALMQPEPIAATISAGVALVPSEAHSLREILALTKFALHESKRTGKNRASIDPMAAAPYTKSAGLDFDALDTAAYEIERVPIVRLEDRSTIACRLLIHGPHPFNTNDTFVDLARKMDVLATAELAGLKLARDVACGMDGVDRIHLLVSPSTIQEVGAQTLIELLAPLTALKTVCLEISEKQLSGDLSAVTAFSQALKDAGILFGLSHFMFGRTSLESFLLFEPDVVVLDPVSVECVALDRRKYNLLARLLKVLATMDCEVIAAGTLSADDRVALKGMGIQLREAK